VLLVVAVVVLVLLDKMPLVFQVQVLAVLVQFGLAMELLMLLVAPVVQMVELALHLLQIQGVVVVVDLTQVKHLLVVLVLLHLSTQPLVLL
jgi:hypothetical protein